MPKKEQPLFVISNDFVDNVLHIISDTTDLGRALTLRILNQAQMTYNQPRESRMSGWMYQLRKNNDTYERLQLFKILIEKEEWKTTSYNYFFFRELIAKIPGYKVLEEEYAHAFILELKDLIHDKIDALLIQHELNEKIQQAHEKIKQARDEELRATEESTKKRSDKVLIVTNQDDARAAVLNQPSKDVFYFTKSTEWKLFLVDATGKDHALELTKELSLRLKNKNLDEFAQFKSVHLNPIKNECVKAKKLLLARVQVIINPEKGNADLCEQGICSTFILRHNGSESSLWWINSLGNLNKISLQDYPQLDTWLHDYSTPKSEPADSQLKLYLLNIKTTQAIESTRLDALNGLLTKSYSKRLPTEKLNMTQFQNIALHLENRMKLSSKTESVLKEPILSLETFSSPQELKQCEVLEKTVAKPLSQERYDSLAQLPNFWQKKRMDHGETEQGIQPLRDIYTLL